MELTCASDCGTLLLKGGCGTGIVSGVETKVESEDLTRVVAVPTFLFESRIDLVHARSHRSQVLWLRENIKEQVRLKLVLRLRTATRSISILSFSWVMGRVVRESVFQVALQLAISARSLSPYPGKPTHSSGREGIILTSKGTG